MTSLPRDGYIDSWRCIAVSIVVFSHLFPLETYRSIPITGELGVFIFFFISGFVVSKTCLHEIEASKQFSSLAFYVRRIFRIAPPLLLYVLTCAILGKIGLIEFTPLQALGTASYVCNLSLVNCGWYGGHTWSLAFEEQFYLLFPLLFVWAETSRRPKVPPLMIFAALASLPFWFSISFIGKTGFVVIHGLFVLGYVTAKYPKWHKIWNERLMFAVGMILTFLPVHLLDSLLIEKYYKFIYLVSIPVLILSSGSPPVRKIFELRFATYIGRISYSIYLWQQLFTGYFRELPITYQLVFLAAMVVGCAALFSYIETPLIAYGKKISDRLRLRALASGDSH